MIREKEYLSIGPQPQTYAGVYDGKVPVLEGIEKEEASSSALPATPVEGEAGKYPSASSAISVKDLLGLVKEDRGEGGERFLREREAEADLQHGENPQKQREGGRGDLLECRH